VPANICKKNQVADCTGTKKGALKKVPNLEKKAAVT